MDGVVLRGATVWAGADPAPRAAWLLVRDGVVAALGAPGEEPPPHARAVDLPGHHVVPGFVDAHSHLGASAFLPAVLDGSAWRDASEALAAVRAAAARLPPERWVVAMQMDHDDWPDPTLPDAGALEEAAGGRPVLLAEMSLHRGVLSESGLRRAGLPFPADPAGDVVRGRGGAPTGLVWESAFGRAFYRALRGLAAGMASDGLATLLEREAWRHLRLGITRAHEPGVPPDAAGRLAALRGRTPLRLSWSAGAADGLLAPPPAPEAVSPDAGDAPPSVKLFADGAHRCALCLPVSAVVGATGAAIRAALAARDVRPLARLAAEPMRLAVDGVHVPWLRLDDEALRNVAQGHGAAGHRLRIHALGNLAAQQAVRALEAVHPAAGATLEHVMALRERDLDAIAASGAAVSLQPGFIPHYGGALLARGMVGPLRALPLRSLAARGVAVSISSDNPCGPLDPLHNLRLAVTRAMPDGRVVDAREALERSAALHAATIAGAAAIGLPTPPGIAPGAPADLAVCDGDPFAPATRVVATWVDGREVWSATAVRG